MWKFKVELKEDLLDGRTLTYIANKIGITLSNLSLILNGVKTTRKITAYSIIRGCEKEGKVEDYFIEIK